MDEENKHEIIIIRRRPSTDMDAGKGGAWKIAFADFMTAMMAFFLVLWILSATKKETQKAIAHYFNPFQLSDAKLNKKGVENQNTKDSAQSEDKADLSQEANQIQRENKNEQSKKLASGNNSDESINVDSKSNSLVNVANKSEISNNPYMDSFFLLNDNSETQKIAAFTKDSNPSLPKIIENSTKNENSTMQDGKDNKQNQEQISNLNTEDPELIEIKNQLALVFDKKTIDTDLALKKIKEGVLISLTDELNFEMFDNGDIAPNSKILFLLNAISQILSKHENKIVIRGHTDSKQFKNKLKDNWQLSASRAISVMYILINAGLPEKNIARVEAYSDHLPKNNGAQSTDEDRRIDILLLKDN